MKSTKFQVRIEPELTAKMRQIQLQTGLNSSQVFRELLKSAEIQPAQINVKLKRNSDAKTLAGEHVAVSV